MQKKAKFLAKLKSGETKRRKQQANENPLSNTIFSVVQKNFKQMGINENP